jgi:MSHA biogenesis protein MshO
MKKPAAMRENRGFTMIEAIVSIVIAGIVAGMVAVFIRTPIDGYISAQRRSELSDVADTAVRRMARDIRAALPNSVRMSADNSGLCLEFIPTKIGARYRAVVDGAGNGNVLDFTTVDDSFDMLWPNTALPVDGQVAAGDVVAVYNDGSVSGNAYSGINAIQVAAVTTPGGTANSTAISFVAVGAAAPFGRKQLPSESPEGSFQIIPAATHVVSYYCNGNQLTRHTRVLSGAWNLPANCAAMTAAPAVMAVMANNLATCSLVYERPGVSTGLSRFGIVSMSIGISVSGETVNLYHQVHVENTP